VLGVREVGWGHDWGLAALTLGCYLMCSYLPRCYKGYRLFLSMTGNWRWIMCCQVGGVVCVLRPTSRANVLDGSLAGLGTRLGLACGHPTRMGSAPANPTTRLQRILMRGTSKVHAVVTATGNTTRGETSTAPSAGLRPRMLGGKSKKLNAGRFGNWSGTTLGKRFNA